MCDTTNNKGATATKEGQGEECMKGEKPQKVRKKRRPGRKLRTNTTGKKKKKTTQ